MRLFRTKSTLVFFLVCGTLSLSLSSSKLFGGNHTQKKKKKTETIPVRGHQNQIITYSKKSRLNNVILFLSKNKSLPWWAFECDGRRRKANDKDARDRKLQKRGKKDLFRFQNI